LNGKERGRNVLISRKKKKKKNGGVEHADISEKGRGGKKGSGKCLKHPNGTRRGRKKKRRGGKLRFNLSLGVK